MGNTKVDVEIDYPNLQEGNLVGLETYVVSTKGSASKVLSYEKGLYIPQEGTHASLGFTWDSEADFDMSKNGHAIRVRASAAEKANLDDLENKPFLLGAIGARRAFDASLEVDKFVFSFNTSTAGKIVWDPTVGINEPETPLPAPEPISTPTAEPTAATTDDRTDSTTPTAEPTAATAGEPTDSTTPTAEPTAATADDLTIDT